MKLLITGGCGFLGANLAHAALARGHDLCVLDNLSRAGSRQNLNWLRGRKVDFSFEQEDVSDSAAVTDLIAKYRPDAVFHLAGQVAMTTSIENPYRDFQVNALGTVNVLEALRLHSPEATMIYASTNKVYGDLEQHHYDEAVTRYTCPARPNGFSEIEPLSFHSPYGCSKGAADQYCLDYARIYGIHTVVLRHSSMYGGQQFATADQGWIGWFCAEAVRNAKSGRLQTTISGNGKQVRDILHVDDVCQLYYSCLDHIHRAKGNAYNIGGGMSNSLSLIELMKWLEAHLGLSIDIKHLPTRLSDQKIFVSDNESITTAIGWTPRISAEDGLAMMIDWTRKLLRDQ